MTARLKTVLPPSNGAHSSGVQLRAGWTLGRMVALALVATAAATRGADVPQREFYLPENPGNTIVESTLDSLRFTLDKTLKEDRADTWFRSRAS